MKFDKEYFANYLYNGEKWYSFQKLSDRIDMCIGKGGSCVLFEHDTLEQIGGIFESDNRTNFKRYYNANCVYGWDGKNKTRKQFVKTLCTKATYQMALALVLEEYKNRKAA